MSTELDNPPKPTTLAVLDIDRTLIKSGGFFEIMKKSIFHRLGLDDELLQRLNEAEKFQEGNAFDTIGWLYEQTGEKDLLDPDTIFEWIVGDNLNFSDSSKLSEELIKDVLVDGVIDLLEAVKQINAKALLLTAGGSVLQIVKVRLLQRMAAEMAEAADKQIADIEDHIVIPDSKQYKTELVYESMRDGTFDIGTLVDHGIVVGNIDGDEYTGIKIVYVFDDKKENTKSVDNNAIIGIQVLRDGKDGAPGISLHLAAEHILSVAA